MHSLHSHQFTGKCHFSISRILIGNERDVFIGYRKEGLHFILKLLYNFRKYISHQFTAVHQVQDSFSWFTSCDHKKCSLVRSSFVDSNLVSKLRVVEKLKLGESMNTCLRSKHIIILLHFFFHKKGMRLHGPI